MDYFPAYSPFHNDFVMKGGIYAYCQANVVQ
jgi:hypothetical protein